MQTTIGSKKDLPPALENALAAYRHDIFIERLGWPLPVENGLERDQFDHPNTFYGRSHDPDGTI